MVARQGCLFGVSDPELRGPAGLHILPGDVRRLPARLPPPESSRRFALMSVEAGRGRVVFTKTPPVRDVIAESGDEIINVHFEDIQGRKHVHRHLGHRDIDFVDVSRGLKTIGYGGRIYAEYNNHDLEVDECRLARQTLEHLRQRM